jgi:hypothetical protein
MNTKKPLKHGTMYVYTSRKCRCDSCRAAAKDYRIKLQAEALPDIERAMDVIRNPAEEGFEKNEVMKAFLQKKLQRGGHGTLDFYTMGCRCEDCRFAKWEYIDKRRKRIQNTPKALEARRYELERLIEKQKSTPDFATSKEFQKAWKSGEITWDAGWFRLSLSSPK